jgi:hypothetical protein
MSPFAAVWPFLSELFETVMITYGFELDPVA